MLTLLFLNRFEKSLNRSWLYVAGDVRYKGKRGEMTIVTKNLYPYNYFLKNSNILETVDSFNKSSKYSYQNEWSICLFSNIKDDKTFVLDVGDLSDIVEIIEENKWLFNQKILTLLLR